MKNKLLKKQIPTILGLVILFLGAGAGVILVGSGGGFLPRASPEYAPKEVAITNVKDREFTVSWMTDDSVAGFVKYGTSSNSLTTTVSDDRDQLTGNVGSFKVHHVTVKGLDPSTTYYFKIGSGPSQNLYDDNGQPYQVITGTALGAPSGADTIYGEVITSANTPAEGAVLYLSNPKMGVISTMVKSSGSWAASLSLARTPDLTAYFVPEKSETFEIKVLGPDGIITVGKTTLANSQPVPQITLGKDFNFTDGESSDNSTNKSKGTSGYNLDPLENAPNIEESEVVLINPGFEGEVINSTQPEIQGSAPPNTVLSIEVHSPVAYVDEVTSSSDGSFNWTPPENLTPGEHKITISWIDTSGVKQFFTRNFVVLAQGQSSLPAFESTPSASPRPSASPTPRLTASPSPTPSPTASPRTSPRPSPSPTPRASASPSPSASASPVVRTSQPSTSSGVPVAGNTAQTLLMLFLGMGLVLSGYGLSNLISEEK